MKKAVTNLPASVRQRPLNLATERKEDFGLVLSRYGLERFLYRLSVSPHRDSFVLKGALLLQVWTGEIYRPTRDLDLLQAEFVLVPYADFNCLKLPTSSTRESPSEADSTGEEVQRVSARLDCQRPGQA